MKTLLSMIAELSPSQLQGLANQYADIDHRSARYCINARLTESTEGNERVNQLIAIKQRQDLLHRTQNLLNAMERM